MKNSRYELYVTFYGDSDTVDLLVNEMIHEPLLEDFIVLTELPPNYEDLLHDLAEALGNKCTVIMPGQADAVPAGKMIVRVSNKIRFTTTQVLVTY